MSKGDGGDEQRAVRRWASMSGGGGGGGAVVGDYMAISLLFVLKV